MFDPLLFTPNLFLITYLTFGAKCHIIEVMGYTRSTNRGEVMVCHNPQQVTGIKRKSKTRVGRNTAQFSTL